MLKFIFEYLTDLYSLFKNPIQDFIIVSILGLLACEIAFRAVGDLYRFDIIDGRGAGKLLHWIIRFIVLTAFVFIGSVGIRVHNWFIALPTIKWWIIGGTVLLVIGCCIACKIRKYLRYERVR